MIQKILLTIALGLMIALLVRHFLFKPKSTPSAEPAATAAAVQEKWSYQLSKRPNYAASYHTPAIGSDGMIYAIGDGYLVALNASGERLWQYPGRGPGAQIFALIADSGDIWTANKGGWVDRISVSGMGKPQYGGMGSANHMACSWSGLLLATGSRLSMPIDTAESKMIGKRVGPLGDVAFGSKYAVVLHHSSRLESWSSDLSSSNWSREVDSGCHRPTLAQDGTIYLACPTQLIAIKPDGIAKWALPFGPPVADSGKSTLFNPPVSAPVIAQDGMLFLGSNDGYLYSVNPNGTIQWDFKVGARIRSTPAISRYGVIYVGSQNGNLYALNSSGNLLWTFKTGGEVFSPTIGSDGTVYFESSDGILHAIAQPENGPLDGQWPKLDADMANTARIAQ
jgi:outer membrane protein assembly factor BamB